MKAWLALAQARADEIGRLGVAGVGLIVFSIAFACTALLPAHDELAAARDRYQHSIGRSGNMARMNGDRTAELHAAFARFGQHFPAADDARQDLLRLQGFAANHGIQLRTGEYRVASDTDSGLIRYHVVLPVKGSYLNVRAFVTEALEQLPSLALDAASFKRDGVAARELDARLNFTFYTSGS